MADRPGLAARQAQAGDVAQHGRGKQQLAGTSVRGAAHLAAGDELLHAELVGAFEHDRRGHGDHGAWERVSITHAEVARRQNLPGRASIGHPIASWIVNTVLLSRWLIR